ncbi:NAD/NADP dependent alcohol dehydrogenase [Chamberlinius hualienensis]
MSEGKTITCRAAVVWKFKQPVSIEEVQVAPPAKGEVRVKIEAVGLCHTDLGALDGSFADQLLPFVLGHEGGGIVESVGEGVTSVKPGDKVLTLFVAQCRKCGNCKDDRSNTCLDIGRVNPSGAFGRSLGYDGLTKFTCKGKALNLFAGSSSFSEYTVIPETSCVRVDPSTQLDKGCLFACGYSTGYGASHRAVDVRPGDVTAVWGLGGVGLPTVAGCRDKGAAKIIGVNYSKRKEQLGRKFGCTDFIALTDLKEPLPVKIKQMTNGLGLDFAFVCVGDARTMETAIECLKPGGSCVLVGATPEEIKIHPDFLLAGRKIIGTSIGGYKIRDELPALVQRFNAGKLPVDDLITGFYRLEQINELIDQLRQSKSIRSIVLM